VTQPEATAPVAPAVAMTEKADAQKTEEILPSSPPEKGSESVKKIASPELKVADKPVEKPLPKPDTKAHEAVKAQALLDGKTADAAKKADASEGRFVVQVGAFADAVRAREVRQKVEHAGLKTYTHVAETKDGSRIRVRVGPFATRAEADKAAEKIKKLALPAAILTL
jgi:DedD protein